MTVTRITNIIKPTVFNPYVIERTNALSALYTSGIIAPVEDLNILASKGGSLVNVPFWKDLTGDDEVLSESSPLTAGAITSGQDIAVLHARGRAWGVNDLAKALSGDDPMRVIGDMVAAYWARRMQAVTIASLTGAFAASSMSGLVHDIHAESGAAANFSGPTFVDACQKLGDAKDKLAAVIMHSYVQANLLKAGLIEFRADAEGALTLPYFMGKRVIVDDTMPTATGQYTSYIFGAGALGYGEGGAPVPTETDRDSLQGDDILINRKHFVLHPRGCKWKGTPSGVSPTNVELAVGTNWERVYEVKSIRMVKFVTAG